MENTESLFKTAIDEVERMLSSKTVVGEPIAAGDNTIIPLISVGFGFGAACGSGKESKSGEGAGGGTGAGGGVKPVAVLVVNQDGVRMEQVKSPAASVLEKAVDTIGSTIKDKKEQSN